MSARGSSGAIATTYVRVRPDTSTFKQEAEQQLSPELRAIQQRIQATRAQADALGAKVDANRAARAAQETAGINQQATALTTLAARAGLVAGALYEVKKAYDAAATREADLAQVAQSVSNAGLSWTQYGKQVTDALDAQRRASGFALADITQSFTRLEQAFKDPAKALQELAVAEDVARGQGKDLQQVAISISEAAQGQFSNLNQLGTVTKALTTEQDKLKASHAALIDSGATLSATEQAAYADRLQAAKAADDQATSEKALADLAARNAGQSQAYIQSTSGQVSQLRTSLTQLEEQLGGPLTVAFGQFAQAAAAGIQHLVTGLGYLGTGIQTVTGFFDSGTHSAEDFANAVTEATTAGTKQQGLDQLVRLLRESAAAAQTAGHLGKNSADVFSQALAQLARQNPALARQIQDLDGIARAAGGLQNVSDIEIKVTLTAPDTTAFTEAVIAQIDKVRAYAAQQLSATFDPSAAAGLPGFSNFSASQGIEPQAPDRGGHAAAVKQKAKKDAQTYTTAFTQEIDAGGIAQALDDAIGAARDQLSGAATSLAGAVGDALDKRLANTEKKIDDADARIQARIAARQQAADQRNSATTQLDAETKLKELQAVLGPGALTADQQVALQQAKDAVANARDDIANGEDQAQSDALSARKTTLESQEAAEKQAAEQRINDLTSEFNRGLITQAQYVKGVNALLAKEQVTYKTTGQLLGTAFADGFADSLKGVVEQAQELGLVGRSTLKAKGTAQKAVSPLGAESTAIQAFIDQVKGSGGKFSVTNADKLPPGVNLGDLLSKAGAARADAEYRYKSGKDQGDTAHYTGLVADHTKQILDELKKANAKPPVVVDDGKKAKQKVAQAAR